ncbi:MULTISPECIES: helix-turn-helix domain-containing protein [Acinetobacter]|uniref:Helix-turn-helix domain-containing protein n=1 Tax=Acinetobacter corruptisaponis TaxID=3045147 RepID=A0ABY8S7S5_9GAMM|nr:helix-turn-helix domain-containing protein [Acinetobacter sp. KCTC 92772]WHP07009.1 helix-turn-helix domain-containing protein [Acinetobacter sp. KCTC 92772]
MGSMQNPQEHWDRYAIKAAIYRKGKTLAALARDHAMSETTLRTALDKPCKSAELIIAGFLDQPVYVLFPERWTKDGKRIYPRVIKRMEAR